MKIIVVGLGYVGLPLAVQLAKYFDCTGLDIDTRRVAELRDGIDRTNEIATDVLSQSSLKLTSDPNSCSPADVYVITVPTPIDENRNPDLSAVQSATRMVANLLDKARRPIVVYESTVYPGVTDDVCAPLIEEISGLKRGSDFSLGYSPERINPGDREHTVDRITKVVAGENEDTLETLAQVYGKVTSGGVFRAKSIRAAEAAKVIENAQRDINIAFMNEITQIFARLGISIWDVLDAAHTKWNFLPFQPGLVGGHCIGVDPYYLSFRSLQLGHQPDVILSGRATNDQMAHWIADQLHSKRRGKPGSVLMLGLTFKEDVPDLRNSKVADLLGRLSELGHIVTVHDPLASADEARDEYGVKLDTEAFNRTYDLVVAAVPHRTYREFSTTSVRSLLAPGGTVADLKGIWRDRSDLADETDYWSL